MNKNILDFYLKAMELKNVERTGWREVGVSNVESVMDHVGGTIIFAMAINAEKNLNLDMEKVYEMIVIKELKKVVSKKEDSIITGPTNSDTSEQLLNILTNNSELIDVYNEYNEGVSKEAKFASMICKLESDIQTKKYELDGEFTIENAKKDIENYPEDLKEKLTNIQNASDGWLEYNKQYYDEMFKEFSSDIQKLN